MDPQSKAQISLVVIITGLVVVFAVLILLILIVKGFGRAVQSLEEKLEKKSPAEAFAEPKTPEVEQPAGKEDRQSSGPEEMPGEVVAAIAAAVYSLYPEGRVTSVRRSARPSRSAWSMAGMLESTRPF